MYTIALILLFLTALAFAFHQALVWFLRPPTKTEVGNALKVQSLEKIASRYGKSPYIWIPKKYGPLGVRQFRAADYFAHMRRKAIHRIINQRAMGLANVGESFHPLGVETMYPSDVIPGSTSNPYTNARYSLVKQAAPGTTLGAALQWGGMQPLSDDICTMMAAGDISIPLGICTDEPGGATLDTAPYSTNVQLLGNAAGATSQLITDKQVFAGQLLVPSSTVAGEVSTVPNIAGVYWCVGLAISSSEGATTLIEADVSRFPISVDEIT